MIKTEGGCTCARTYSPLGVGSWSGEKNSHAKGDVSDADPRLRRERAGRSGVLSPAYSPLAGYPPAARFAQPPSPHPRWHPLDTSHHAQPRESPVHLGTGTGMVLPASPAAPRCHPPRHSGGRGATALTKPLMTATGLYYKHLSLI